MPTRRSYLNRLQRYLRRCEAQAGEIPRTNSDGHGDGREFLLQLEAFEQRRQQLRDHIQRLAGADDGHWRMLSEDADRVCRALRLSLEYFGREVTSD